jgi:hypothetical protein
MFKARAQWRGRRPRRAVPVLRRGRRRHQPALCGRRRAPLKAHAISCRASVARALDWRAAREDRTLPHATRALLPTPGCDVPRAETVPIHSAASTSLAGLIFAAPIGDAEVALSWRQPTLFGPRPRFRSARVTPRKLALMLRRTQPHCRPHNASWIRARDREWELSWLTHREGWPLLDASRLCR